MIKRPSLNRPTYDSTKDGNVFQWILEAAADFRKIKQRESYIEMRKQTRENPNKD